jgi:thiol-disulfide isomerase/thioredoxin
MFVTMSMRSIVLALVLQAVASASIITDVRAAIAKKDFAAGESLIAAYRAQKGVTPEMIEAVSWLGRGALAAKDYDKADDYAAQARKLALAELANRKMDAEPHLPLALGATQEVHALVLDARGERGEAVSFLRAELATYRDTSIRTRIQKNINVLSLEGKPAPVLEMAQWIGDKPTPLDRLKGKPVLLFFWAHWCGDCKNEVADIAKLVDTYGPKGLVLVGPTQHYGYVAKGQDATPDVETPYIAQVRQKYYAPLASMTVPLSQENFKNFGASTTPTLVLLDRNGVVQLYHPGAMPYDQLAAKIAQVLGD